MHGNVASTGQLKTGRRSVIALAAGALSGGLVALSLCGDDLFWLGWVALIPFFWAVYGDGVRRAVAAGAVAGAVHALVRWHWLPSVTFFMVQSRSLGWSILIVLCIFGSLVFAVFGGLVAWEEQGGSGGRPWWKRRLAVPVFAAVLWVGMELLQNAIATRYSLLFVSEFGYSQWAHPAIVQTAALGGVYAVSFLLVLFNASLSYALRTSRWMEASPAMSVVLVCVAAGWFGLHIATKEADGKGVRVAVLQCDIPPFEKYNKTQSDLLAKRHFRLSQQVADSKPNLIVWSEAAIPWPLEDDDALVGAMLKMTRKTNASHILGGVIESREKPGHFHNAAFLVLPDGRLVAQYNKRKLIAFGEATLDIPFLSRDRLLPEERKYLAGNEAGVFESQAGKVGIIICNENMYPSVVREVAQKGADFVVMLANDAWFGRESVVRQHFMVSVFRAVETGRAMVAANNSGVSGIIDRHGRIRSRSEPGKAICLSGEVFLGTGRTVYTRAGDLFGLLCVAGIAMFGVRHAFASRIGGRR